MSLKPILPKRKPFSEATFRKELNGALDATMRVGKTLLSRTVKSWNHAVVIYVVKAQDQIGAVGTDDKIFGFVTRGTRPHIIRPKRGKFLSWESGKYKAKTTVGKLSSKGRGSGLQPSGGVGKPVFARKVHHKGTKARGFEEALIPLLVPILKVNVEKAIQKTMF